MSIQFPIYLFFTFILTIIWSANINGQNDLCSDAIPISCEETLSGTTFEATTDTDEAFYCGGSIGIGIWYTFIGTGENTTFSTCNTGTDFYTQISVYDGDCSNLNCIGGDIYAETCSNSFASEITLYTSFGQTYYILVHGSQTGNFDLSVSCNLTADQDFCNTALPISCGESLIGTTIGASIDIDSENCSPSTGTGIWYSFIATGEDATFSTCSSSTDFDARISIYDGECNTLNCIAYTQSSCDDNEGAEITIPTISGDTYYILVNSYGTGNFELSVSCATLPLQNFCTTSIPISCGESLSGSNIGAMDIDASIYCGGSIGTGVWYTFIGTNENTTFSTCSEATDFYTKISIYDGDCSALNCIGGDTFAETCSNPNASEITLYTSFGQTYYILVHGAQTGNFDLSVSCSLPPSQDFCSTALPISCGETLSGTTIDASIDLDSGDCGPSIGIGIWYFFIGTGENSIFSTCSSATDFDARISIYDGECSALNCMDYSPQNSCSDNEGAEIMIPTILGETYYILVNSYETGNFELSVSCATLPPEDFCTTATLISCGESLSGSTIGAMDVDASIDCGGFNSPGVGYFFIGTGDNVSFSTCSSNTDFFTYISIFDGACGSLNCISDPNSYCLDTGSEVTISTVMGTTYYLLVNGGSGNFDLTMNCNTINSLNPQLISPKMHLQGALYNSPNGLMRDDLRVNHLIPFAEPYTALNDFSHVGEGGGETIDAAVLAVEGPDAIVDWVFLELRDPIDPSQVLATRSALVQRDGDVVEVDGISAVEISGIEGGDYYVAVRHRNHLGAMSATPFNLNLNNNIDFTTGNTWGVSAQVDISGSYALWAGNANVDDKVIFQGLNNELNNIFFEILGAPGNIVLQLANYTYEGYNIGDLDMNSLSIYQGLNNEINILFFNALSHPGNTTNLANYVIEEQLP